MGCDSSTAPAPGGGSLPPARSFVVQFGVAAVPSAGVLVGRIEHIDSGRSRRFASLEELAGFVAEVFEAAADDDPS